jgi:phenylalanyl-tRNA synthetase alpha chain
MSEVVKLEQQLLEFEQAASKSLADAKTQTDIELVRQEYLGQKGALNNILRSLSQIDKEDRPRLGQSANTTKEKLETLYLERKKVLDSQELKEKLKTEKIDVSVPARGKKLGHLHPITQILNEIENIFLTLGFAPFTGPEVETEYYNFDALNFPYDHPSRDEQDTCYTDAGQSVVLRCHTSSVQVRAMEKFKPPLRFIFPGRVYRNEEINARKYPVFHQVEGLLIDRNVGFGQLKGTLNEFIRLLFGKPLKTRFRPDFFPFTEPSAELDSECPFCDGKGCKTCGHKGWLELLGCGMVDPNVLKVVNIDPEIWNGFAFGMGVERLAMLKYGITDIRNFYNNDIRFLEQF